MALRHRWFWFFNAAIGVVAVSFALWHFTKRAIHAPYTAYDPQALAFDGSSDLLEQTVVVPTLTSPIPEGKSAIWCVSFQLAWNRLKDEVASEPLELTNSPALVDLLDQAEQTEDDLDPNSVYAAAGFAKDNIAARIREEMAVKFPDVPAPELDVPPPGGVAYAYLAVSSRFEYPYFENDEPFLFTDSAGKQRAVGSFGIRKKDDYAYSQLRRQVQVLYCPRAAISREKEVPEFIVDLCRTSEPYQIVVARVDRQATLADTLVEVERKIASKEAFQLGPRDVLLVPNIALRVIHRFRELEGQDKEFTNRALSGLYVDTAQQTIQFQLNRSGAELRSESKIVVTPSASFYHCNRPFLVYLKKRDRDRPFFVMWVENAELLEQK